MTLHVLNLHVFLHLIFTDILWNVYYHLRLTDKDMVVSGLHDLSNSFPGRHTTLNIQPASHFLKIPEL